MTIRQDMVERLANSIVSGALEAGANARMLSVWIMESGDVDLVVKAYRDGLSLYFVPEDKRPTSPEETESLMDSLGGEIVELISSVRSEVRAIGLMMFKDEVAS